MSKLSVRCLQYSGFAAILLCSPTASTSATALEEVIVSVQKSEEALQKTPAAISAISSQQLTAAGVTDARDLQALLSAVRLQRENSSTEIYIRGVGSTLDFPQLDPPTSLHLNGIYIPREATSLGLYDLEQVEVLRGPQGTLYARSSLGGLVNANFRRPTRDSETTLLIEAGNYQMTHLSAAQNIPLNEALAVRVAGDYLYREGYNTSGADSADNYGLRLSFVYTPNERLSAYVWGSTAKLDGHPPNLVVKGVDPYSGDLAVNEYLQSNPWNDRLPAPWNGFLPFGQPAAEDYLAYDNRLIGAEITWTFSQQLQLTYIPSYLDFEISDNYWLAAFPANKTDRYRQSTHELRLNGENSRSKWMLGLHQYDLESSGFFMFGGFDRISTPDLTGLPIPVSIVDDNSLDGVAVFGQVAIKLNAATRVTVGARYSEDTRSGYGRFFNGVGLAPYDSDEDYDNVDYKLAVDHDLSSDLMIYAAVQTGFQPGTFNPYASTPTASNRVDAAELIGYTLGFKSRLAAQLLLNAELFFYDYDGLFAAAYNTVLNATQTFNAAQTDIKGAQMDMVWAVTELDAVNLTLEYVHARYTDFVLPDGTAEYSGYQAQYSPDWTLVAGYHHDFPLPSGYLRFAVSRRFESEFYADFAHTPGGRQRAHSKTNLQLTYFANDDHWSAGIWVKNIENEAVMAATAAGSQIPPNPAGATAFLESPRTLGVRLTMNY